jgi:hypothetical protein
LRALSANTQNQGFRQAKAGCTRSSTTRRLPDDRPAGRQARPAVHQEGHDWTACGGLLSLSIPVFEGAVACTMRALC